MRTWSFRDKSNYGDGPWTTEPDKVQWIDEATGLPCLIVRNGLGALCGYVGVAETHPLYQKDDGDPATYELNVHGGLTFSGHCQEDAAHGICHVTEPGQPDTVWWLGFDCAHAGDYIPSMPTFDRKSGYKTVAYVTAECASLARQLNSAKGEEMEERGIRCLQCNCFIKLTEVSAEACKVALQMARALHFHKHGYTTRQPIGSPVLYLIPKLKSRGRMKSVDPI